MFGNIIKILSFGLTTLIAVFLGDFLFKNVKGGVKVPVVSGSLYVGKPLGFIFFFISTFITGFLSSKLQHFLNSTMSQSAWTIVISILGVYLLFNQLFYSR